MLLCSMWFISLAVVCSANMKGKLFMEKRCNQKTGSEKAAEGYQTLDFPPDHGLFVLLCMKPLINPAASL